MQGDIFHILNRGVGVEQKNRCLTSEVKHIEKLGLKLEL